MNADTSEPSRKDRSYALIERLLDAWDGLRPRQTDTPKWVARLAFQLDLWVGDELDHTLYQEIGYDHPPTEAHEAAGKMLDSNALNSSSLYLRAISTNFFVAVDVQKASGQNATVEVAVFLAPRSHLASLEVEEIDVHGLGPDTTQLTLRYAGRESAFVLPRNEDPLNFWEEGEDTKVFRALRDDLWAEAGASGSPVLPYPKTLDG